MTGSPQYNKRLTLNLQFEKIKANGYYCELKRLELFNYLNKFRMKFGAALENIACFFGESFSSWFKHMIFFEIGQKMFALTETNFISALCHIAFEVEKVENEILLRG